jgi:hypothetical protein
MLIQGVGVEKVINGIGVRKVPTSGILIPSCRSLAHGAETAMGLWTAATSSHIQSCHYGKHEASHIRGHSCRREIRAEDSRHIAFVFECVRVTQILENTWCTSVRLFSVKARTDVSNGLAQLAVGR